MGILASSVADSSRQVLKPLAFQDVGHDVQPEALTSTQTSFDKKSVRDDHYPNLGSVPFPCLRATRTATRVNATVKALIDALNGENLTVARASMSCGSMR